MSKKFCALTCCFVLMLVPLLLCGNRNATSDTEASPENVLKSPETIISIDSKVGGPSKYRPNPHIIGRGTMISEGFEGTFPPAGWDTLSLSGTQGGSTLIPWNPDANYACSGTYGAAYGWGYNLNGWLRILNLDFSSVIACTLSYWWESSYYWHVDPFDNGDLFVEVSIDGGTSWDTLWTFGDSADVVNSGGPWPWENWTWYQSTLILDAYAGQPDVYVGFHTVADDNADMAIDDVLIDTTFQDVEPEWKIYANSMPVATYYHASAYSEVTGTPTVYCMGGNPTFTSIQEFDCTAETWSTSSYTLNHAAQRTTAGVVDGKIYVLGGCDAGFNAHSFNQEYDPVAGTVTDRAALPTARHFAGAAAWNDTLIYVIGGQAATYYNIVEIYDPANDAWTTGTALPITNRSYAIGIWGNTIYATGGWNGAYVTTTWIGEIDPVTPQTITWTQGPDVPMGSSSQAGRSRLQGACVMEKFYFTGGDDHGSSYPAFDTWFYDPADSLWHQDLDKPTAISNSQCAVYAPALDGGTFFCPGGYNVSTSSATAATEGLINLGAVGIVEEPGKPATFVFGLLQNAPNPAENGRTTIQYATIKYGPVSLKIYDNAGRLVRTLVDAKENAGRKTVNWNGKDNNNNLVTAGVYFYKLTAEGKSASKKIVVVR